METLHLAESINKTTGWRFPVVGINVSLLAVAALFSYTKRGRELEAILTQGSGLDFSILTLALTLSLMAVIAYTYGSARVHAFKQKSDIAMLETVLGVMGIGIIGGVGASPIYILLCFLTLLLLRSGSIYKYELPAACVLIASSFLLSSPGLSVRTTTLLLSLGMSLSILGTISLESIIKNRSINMFGYYFMLISALLGAFMYSPITFIIFPIVTFCNLNSHAIGKVIKKIPVVSSVREYYAKIMKKRKVKIFFTFLLKVTNIVLLGSIIAWFVLHFSAWYTNNPKVLGIMGISVSDNSPIFIGIAEKIGYLLDTFYTLIHTVLRAVRPKNIALFLLNSVRINPQKPVVPNSLIKQIVAILYRILLVADNAVMAITKLAGTILYAGCYLVINLSEVAGFMANIARNLFAKTIYIFETAMYFLLGRRVEIAPTVLEPSMSFSQTILDAMLLPFRLTKSLFSMTMRRRTPPVVVLQPELPIEGNILTAFYGLLMNLVLVLFYGYYSVVVSSIGQYIASDKTFMLTPRGIKPIINEDAAYIPEHINRIPRDNFYQKYFDLYCDQVGIFSRLNENGAYFEQPVIESVDENEKQSMSIEKYTKDQVCKPVSSFEEELQSKISKVGPVGARFKLDEKFGIKKILQYFPSIRSTKEFSEKELKLKKAVGDAKKEIKKFKAKNSHFDNIMGRKKNEGEALAKAKAIFSKAQSDLVQYYTNYYYNMYTLAKHFLNEIDPSVANLVSGSAIGLYNSILPEKYRDISDEYFKSIISLRTALIEKELPFITEMQSAKVFCKPLFLDLQLRNKIQTQSPREGFFIQGISDSVVDYEKLSAEEKGLIVFQELISIKRDADYIHFKSVVSTDPTVKVPAHTITESTGIDIAIRNEDTTVVSVSLNNKPILASVIPEENTGRVLVDLKIPNSLVKNESNVIFTVRMFRGHTSLVHTATYAIA
ncbi:hypothetical protein NEMIN01_1306 [Nematocida minor]|uniref:uncharacterized protein n=1 Tax=Nematocida minor TaxID=1912983 RepID=UPI00221F6FB5|nr:uncharacterized protein NEMIN01_1306 [Nematocida minor]KAI5190973.1 hypothetical protein NEMIN01_1306 [Nematocida minor]